MALNWRWDDKMGTVVGKDGLMVNIYRGNAFMIGCYEYEEDETEKYQVVWFFCDKDHCKRCLGLAKGSDPIGFDWVTFELDVKYKESIQFAQMLAQAQQKGRYPDVKVTLGNWN